MKKALSLFLAGLMVASLSACGNNAEPQPATDENKAVADQSDMAAPQEIEEGTPVYADVLNDGTYDITVESSSSMFNIEACQLTVADGKMTAAMTMGGTGYLYVFPGTGEEAAAASEEQYIPFEENDAGQHVFTIPVEYLDKGVDCAAFSKNKEMWYDRTLVFQSVSLPQQAWKESPLKTVADLSLADGTYQVAVILEGGSGRASVTSPTKLVIADGKATATIEWSSSNYDYMKVDDVQYDPVNTEGNSVFEIPVSGFDWKMPVLADTTAMSTPHEIDYTLTFDSASLEPAS